METASSESDPTEDKPLISKLIAHHAKLIGFIDRLGKPSLQQRVEWGRQLYQLHFQNSKPTFKFNDIQKLCLNNYFFLKKEAKAIHDSEKNGILSKCTEEFREMYESTIKVFNFRYLHFLSYIEKLRKAIIGNKSQKKKYGKHKKVRPSKRRTDQKEEAQSVLPKLRTDRKKKLRRALTKRHTEPKEEAQSVVTKRHTAEIKKLRCELPKRQADQKEEVRKEICNCVKICKHRLPLLRRKFKKDNLNLRTYLHQRRFGAQFKRQLCIRNRISMICNEHFRLLFHQTAQMHGISQFILLRFSRRVPHSITRRPKYFPPKTTNVNLLTDEKKKAVTLSLWDERLREKFHKQFGFK